MKHPVFLLSNALAYLVRMYGVRDRDTLDACIILFNARHKITGE